MKTYGVYCIKRYTGDRIKERFSEIFSNGVETKEYFSLKTAYEASQEIEVGHDVTVVIFERSENVQDLSAQYRMVSKEEVFSDFSTCIKIRGDIDGVMAREYPKVDR